MNIKKALSVFGLTGSDLSELSVRTLKKRYKLLVLKCHPDKEGGCTESTQELNCAFEVICKKSLFGGKEQSSTDSDSFRDWMYHRTEGHPLHSRHLASMYSRDTLINKTFDIREGERIPNWSTAFDRDYSKYATGIYFQSNSRDFMLKTWSNTFSELDLSEVTNGGYVRKQCRCLSVSVVSYCKNISSNSQLLVNVVRDWLPVGQNSSNMSWVEVFDLLWTVFDERNDDQTVDLLGQSGNWEYSNQYAEAPDLIMSVNGSVIRFQFESQSGNKVVNPFNLDAYKPLTAIPKRWKISDLVRVIVNGQFVRLKREYHYTDDYAYDNACGFGEGYIDNPLNYFLDWVGERKRSCTKLFPYGDDENGLHFGKYMNDGNSLIVDLSNRYPILDVNEEINQLLNVMHK